MIYVTEIYDTDTDQCKETIERANCKYALLRIYVKIDNEAILSFNFSIGH